MRDQGEKRSRCRITMWRKINEIGKMRACHFERSSEKRGRDGQTEAEDGLIGIGE